MNIANFVNSPRMTKFLFDMSANKSLPKDFKNPFEGKDPEKVWEKLMKNARPISREEELEILRKS